MSKAQREKGAAAEREVAELLQEYGFEAKRDGRLDCDLAHNIVAVHLEVKRQERLDLPAWIRQAEADAKEDERPIVVYRRNREPWRADLRFEDLLGLLYVEQQES